MICPECGYTETTVTDSRSDNIAVYRRRKCKRCKANFYTTERKTDGYNLKRIARDLSRNYRFKS